MYLPAAAVHPIRISIADARGKTLCELPATAEKQRIVLRDKVPAGLFFVKIEYPDRTVKTVTGNTTR